MFLSIITVVRNGADVIGPTIESVNAQTFRDFEHLVIDGLSNDGTSEVVNRLANKENLRFYSGKDSGIYDAMNKGLDMATGDYVLFLNAGDRLHSPDALETVARLARENNIPGIIYGQTDIVDQNGNYLGPRHLSA
ncbi:MAG: glycosyltransferase, partial [Muribaculaceae bacterium]|nr:glycosyltransferase [Muribaculaceae bacterium]